MTICDSARPQGGIVGEEMITGNIPERVTYFYSSSKKLVTECYWDNPLLKAGWKGQEVIPAFCSNADNEKTCETGKRWAQDYSNKKVETLTRNNDPMPIKILSLEKRNEGGRAYKIVTNENFFFDLREDVLLDTIINCEIVKGVPTGKFIWATVGSEMKLVRVGSDLHKLLIESTEDGKKKKISQKDLEIGGIYRGKSKEKYVFVGFLDADFIDEDYMAKTVRIDRIRNQMLFYHITDYEKTIEWNSFGFEFRKSASSFIEKVGQMKITEKLIEKIRSLEKGKFGFSSIRNPGGEEPTYTVDDIIENPDLRARYRPDRGLYPFYNWKIELT